MAVKIKNITIPTWIILLLSIIFLLRIPNLFEPYSYGDEMIYLTLGQGIRKGLVLYRQLHDNKPPFLYLIAALAGNLFWFKTILMFWSLATITAFWKLTEALFPKKQKFSKTATVIFAFLTTIPLFEGNIANAELFMIGFTITGFLSLITRKANFKNIYIAGVLFACAGLFKIPAVFDVPAIIIFWLLEEKISKKRLFVIAKQTLALLLGFLTPFVITFIWALSQGAFKEYIAAAYLQNVGYLSSWRPGDVQKSFIIRNAPVLIRSGVVCTAVALLLIMRKSLSKQFIFITCWLVFSLFAVTLSERPYPHYLIQSVPAFSLLTAMLITIPRFESILAIIPLSLFFFVPVYFHFWYYQSSPYYIRFYKLMTSQISTQDYLSSFNQDLPNYYNVAKYIIESSKPNDKIFVWGDNGIIYALTRRVPPIKYVADYHIKDFANDSVVISGLMKDPPVFIIITREGSTFPALTRTLNKNYALSETIGGVEIWRLLNPGIRGLIAP